jgi:hypothetical protein
MMLRSSQPLPHSSRIVHLWNVIHQRAALIREPNEVRILRVVRDAGEISRIEIAKLTAEAVHVRSARHGETGVILGAAGLVLYELFEPLHTFSVRSSLRHAGTKEGETADGESGM